MIPVLTPAEMALVDAEAPVAVDVLVGRAGWAVAREALRLLGGAYGRRVVVIAGGGNNGWDGRVAGTLLARRGVRVQVVPPDAESVPVADLVVDAAYGTGFHGSYHSPVSGATPVLAVDIPSGVDGTTGVAAGRPAGAVRTVTFAAPKPGLLYADGRRLAGELAIADIGLDVSRATIGLVEDADVTERFPHRPADSHKWRAAVWVVGGSPGMPGAPALAAAGAFAAGAGYVRVGTPGLTTPSGTPLAAVGVPLPAMAWADEVAAAEDRIGAVVVGPGLGRSEIVRREVQRVAGSLRAPLVLDGDALWAIAEGRGRLADAPRVLTPHDGEFTQLTGHPPGDDRVAAARRLAAERSAVVVLKGPTTTIAEPGGRVRVVTSGDARLATAGTGDVLTGVIAALLARGVEPFEAASLGAHVHGRAGARLSPVGSSAADLPAAVSAALSALAIGAIG